jgi:hypothetical protein
MEEAALPARTRPANSAVAPSRRGGFQVILMMRTLLFVFPVLVSLFVATTPCRAEGEWEITPASEKALKNGLNWLAQNQGGSGNWDSEDLGLVSLGALAFLSNGHRDGIGPNGKAADKALQYVLRNARPSGLLNIAQSQADMYNHGLSTFVLGQAHGMMNDTRISPALDRALKLIVATQCADGGWTYQAKALPHGNDLSLAVMQAKALRSAMDSGLDVPPDAVQLAIRSVREHYSPNGVATTAPESDQMKVPGQFTYGVRGNGPTTAMAAAGVVCLQEFGHYDDWRIQKSMDVVTAAIAKLPTTPNTNGHVPFDDPYTLYYVGQALYQVGGQRWKDNYPRLRDYLIATQRPDGSWIDEKRRSGKPGKLFATSVACFILAIPNRYLPILQEGKIEGLRGKFQAK